MRAAPLPTLAPAPDEVSVGALLLKLEEELLFEVDVLVLVDGVPTLGAVPVVGSGVAGGIVPDPVAPLVSAVMLGEEVLVEPEPVDAELPEPEPEEDPPAAPGVALPPGQTTPGLVSGSWSVVPLLPDVPVLWLPSPDGT
ncbi:MAG: hypothetical protein ACXVFQ_18990 [Solirubrobacteraceae bacterium]